MLRTHRARLALQLRVDFPTGSLEGDLYSGYARDASGGYRRGESRYLVPITVGATLAF